MFAPHAPLQVLLNKRFQDLKSRNPQYSVRAFAKQIGLQASAANEIMKGQRNVSQKMAEKIVDSLKMDPEERSQILGEFLSVEKKKSSVTESNKSAKKLSADQFELISNWVHFAILSLVKLSDFQSDIDWMAKRLGVEGVDVRKALLRLQHLNLIHISERGLITRTTTSVRTSDDILSLSLQEMHLNDMRMAAQKLKEVPVHLRDFTNVTFSGNPKTLPRAKEILRKAQDDLEEIMQEDSHEVYRLCMYLFPLTVNEEKK